MRLDHEQHQKTSLRESIASEHQLDGYDLSGIPEDIMAQPVDLADVEVVKDPKTRSLLMRIKGNKWVLRFGAGAATLLAGAQAVAAESMNWTPIQEMFDGLAGLMPSVSTLIMAVVPVIITLVIVGFITGLLDGIIDAIKNGMSMFKK